MTRVDAEAGYRPRSGFRHPGRTIGVGFAAAVLVGAVLLSLPLSTSDGRPASLVDALFTSTSAVCVTGLVTVDTGTYWSPFGQVVILLLIQVGGLGIMTLATLIAVLLSRRLGLRARLVAQAETKMISGSDIRRVVRNVVLFSLACELIAAIVLTVRFWLIGEAPLDRSVYLGIFHAISAFNNAGFGLYSDSLMQFVADPWITGIIAAAVIIGGLGFPVWFELIRSWRKPKDWTVLTRITVIMTVTLLVVGTIVIFVIEANNPATLGALPPADRLPAAFFASTMTRTAGFNSLDISALTTETLFITDILMFIGGGSAGTAGGIKVTTFGLLAYVLWSEMRGHPDVVVGRRRVPIGTQRQALAIVLLSIGLIAIASTVIMLITDKPFDAVMFETVSAFATVGLSTGITADLPDAAQLILVVLMFVGRIGPLTLASALAAREHSRRHRLPEERMIVG